MKYEKDRKIFGIDEYLIIKFLKKYALPLIAGLLVLIILISDMPKRLRKNKESEPAAVTQAENSGSGEGAACTAFSAGRTIPGWRSSVRR